MAYMNENNETYIIDWTHWEEFKKELVSGNYKWSGNTPIHLTDDDQRETDEIFVIDVYDKDSKLICKLPIDALTQAELTQSIFCLDDKLATYLKRQLIKKEGEKK